MGCKFCFHQEKFAYFWRSVSKRPKIFRAFDATNFFFAATTTFFLLKVLLSLPWPTNCSNLMCMNFHNFWSILGSARAKSLEGAYIPPPTWNKLYLRPHGIGLSQNKKKKNSGISTEGNGGRGRRVVTGQFSNKGNIGLKTRNCSKSI